MRTIKFRGKRIDNFLFVTGDISVHPDTIFITDNISRTISVVHSDSIGQFTGLFDKNGVEIYEGDILLDVEFDENNNDISDKFPVVYDSSKCQFAIDNSFKKDGSSLVNFIEYFGVENLKVVGNIHDNPELL